MIKSRKMRFTQHVTCTGEKRNTYRVLVCKHEEKRLLGRPRHRQKDNINMTVQR
jgi:hypothetical protein